MVDEPRPDATSSDYKAMQAYWDKVDAILGGTDAMRLGRATFLPKFPNESDTDYLFRWRNAKFTNVFRDIVENLAAKPFGEEAGVKDDTASGRIKSLLENIDGHGNHIHVFASDVFFSGIAYAIDWVLVDYTRDVPATATIAQERAIGARPYWVHLPAKRILAAYSAMIDGAEQFVHVRIEEDYVERDGFGEKSVKQVRILNREPVMAEGREEPIGWNPATYQVMREEKDRAGQARWVEMASGPVTIGVIPLVPFMTGRRKGSSWQVVPPMQDAADLQVELFQQESGLKYAKELTCFPMLSASGVEPPVDAAGAPQTVPVGPKSVLYAPPGADGQSGEWKFIEPNATSLRFLADDVKETIQQLRELGRQPLTAQQITVIQASMNAKKANSAIQAWALSLKDAMENALRFTAMWLGEELEAEFTIGTDLDLDLRDEKGPETLLKMRETGDLSQRTLWHEMRRRSILSPEFEPDAEEELILEEVPGDPAEVDLSAALTPAPAEPAPVPVDD